ncbi:hypothetical protein BH11PLA1_BH11PLA1_00060 [soil metagenome]
MSAAEDITLEFHSGSARATERIGAALGALLVGGDVVTLRGDLGAGKTQFTRGVVGGAGLREGRVSSPTFALMHRYAERAAPADAARALAAPHTPGVEAIVHVDAYRLGGGAGDLDELGIDAALGDRDAAVIEWAERVGTWIGEREHAQVVRVAIALGGGEDERVISMVLAREWRERAGFDGLMELSRRDTSVAGEGGDAGSKRPGAPAERPWTTCPVTGTAVAPEAPSWPFASERARLADLGKWFDGGYRVSRALNENDEIDDGGGAARA